MSNTKSYVMNAVPLLSSEQQFGRKTVSSRGKERSSRIMTRYLQILSVLCLLFTSSVVSAVNTPFSSSTGPTLLPGGNSHMTVGAKYIYQNIATSTDGILVDAVVTIANLNNAYIGEDHLSVANRVIDSNIANDNRFEPHLNLISSGYDGYIEWHIVFVQDGSVINATDVGQRAYLNSFTMDAIDVDYTEYLEVLVSNSYTLEGGASKPSVLVVSNNGAYTRFQSPASPGSDGIDATKTKFIVRVNHQNVNEIRFRNGYLGTNTNRQNSLSFSGEVTFNSENTTVVNVPPTVVSNTGNVSAINATFNVNLLTGANDVDGNMVASTIALIDPNDATNLGSVGYPLTIYGVGTYTVSATGDLSFVPVNGYSGSADVLFTVSDALNVSSDRGTLGLTVSNAVAPIVTINAMPVAFDANETAYPVSGTCTAGDGDVSIVIAGAIPNPALAVCTAGGTFSRTVDVSSIYDGIATIIADASQTDATGNTGYATQVTADKDTVVDNPSCIFTPAAASSGTPISVTCTGVEAGSSLTIGTLSCSPESAGSITCSGNAEDAGNNPNIDITDSVGNTNTGTGLFTFNGGAPVVTLNAIPHISIATNEAVYLVGGSCTNGKGDVTVVVTGATPNPATSSCNAGSYSVSVNTTAIADGLDVVIANASQTDTSGNTGNAVQVTADKDTVAPVISLNALTNVNAAFNEAAYPVSGTCTAGDGNVSVSINGATPNPLVATCLTNGTFSGVVNTSGIGEGSNVIIANASQIDAVGNIGSATQQTANKDTLLANPTCVFTPATAIEGESISVTCTGVETGASLSIGTLICSAESGDSINCTGNAEDAGNNPLIVIIDPAGNANTSTGVFTFDGTTPGDDTDNDGVDDSLDIDSDNDGIPDSIENAGAINGGDTDKDGVADIHDLDSDGDGISDIAESGLSAAQILSLDTNGDGAIDEPVGANGLADVIEDVDTSAAVITYNGGLPLDTDGDGHYDFQDLDADNDGIHDLAESGLDLAVFDANNDGVVDDNATDADQDGLADSLDNDDLTFAGVNSNPVDTDGDSVADFRDLDSDNDGIHDLVESGILIPAVVDSNNDGVLDGAADTDNDGIPDSGDSDDTAYGDPQFMPIVDTDSDGVPDYRDLDSDNDSINDIIESGNGVADSDGDGIADGPTLDTDGDGILDSIDNNVANFGDPDAALPDADGDGTPDAQETDSDNDGTNDIVGNGLGGLDTNGDGRIDDSVDSDGDGVPDIIDGANGSFGDSPDLDRDGVADIDDIDDDNDGIPDTVEQLTAINAGDTDGDSIPDSRDLDADGDGINDITESGLTPAQIIAFDADNNGVIDPAVPVGANGLANAIETDDTLGALLDQDGNGSANGPVDTDADSHPDFQDLDADNDSIHDLIEVGGLHPDPAIVDANNDGVIDDNGSDADLDGIPDSIDTNDALPGGLSNTPVDTDRDSVANFRDIDSDRDGITDLYEAGILDHTVVDTDHDGVLDNPTTDSDGDGVPDSGDNADGTYGDPQSAAILDTDGDNVPDYLDLDSDNDSIPDVTEAGNQDDDQDGLLDTGGTTTFPPTNTDGTDNPDHLDLDSNNDGINDIDDAGKGELDADNDGDVDGTTDVDEDGILDPADGEPGAFGQASDSDKDGITNMVDLDDDNDGIPDLAETDASGNDVDTDGDGIVDRLDRDSDNDGIPDSVEATNDVVDADANGVVDGFTDTNNDGLDDRVSPTLVPVDTDADGKPDFRDIDSDNDGLTDMYEANGFDNAGDNNGDGMLDDLTDLDQDGLADVVDPDVAGGVAGTKLPNPDSDGDGISNYREVDSDNDGISDSDENVDADGNGVLDNLQSDTERLETAVNGVGGSLSPFSLFAILLFLTTRLLRTGLKVSNSVITKGVTVLSVIFVMATFSTTADAEINYCGRHNPLNSDADENFKKCIYIGAGYLFTTHVDPEGEAKTWKTSDDSDSGYNIYLGWHFKPRWFTELSYADLGEAGLRTAPPSMPDSGDITYKIPSLHIGYWFFKPEERFNVYAKAGLSSISNKATNSAIPFEKQNRVNITGGVGVQWRSQTSGLFARLAADLYDKDAYSLGINVGYYFGGTSFRNTPVVSLMDDDNDGDGVRNENDLCPKSMIGMMVDVSGCAIPDISLHGVNFRTNSAIITRQSKLILDNAAAALISAPLMRVEVQAHTDSLGKAAYNEDLSARRAMAVRSYLESKGISSDRMEAQGYGETQPIATNKTRAGRQQNRRVELVIIK